MKKIFVMLAAIFLAAATSGAKVKTLLITGQDNSHWDEGSAKVIKKILENTGEFQVSVTYLDNDADISKFRPKFKDYGLVIINYGGETWSSKARKDFEDYVSDGGGVVVLHSSIIPMEDWDEYNKMTGLGAWNGRDEKWGPYLYIEDGRYVYDYTPGWAGHHGLQHKAVVTTQAADNPIMKGLPEKWLHFKDEIYTKLRGPAMNIEILATVNETGKDEPLMWTVKYGSGRVFVDVMGHCGNDPNMTYSMTCTGFQVTFIRGCEWAASGKVTYPVPSDFPTENHYSLRRDFKAPDTAR